MRAVGFDNICRELGCGLAAIVTGRFTRVTKVRVLTSVTFVYDTREDRILTAVNAGHPEAWSCWLTRRLALALLERAAEYLSNTSALAQRAPADLRGEFVAFERDAAIAKTVGGMSNTPADVLKSSATGAELAERLTISNKGDRIPARVARTKWRRCGRSAHAGRVSAHLADAAGRGCQGRLVGYASQVSACPGNRRNCSKTYSPLTSSMYRRPKICNGDIRYNIG